MRNKNIKKKKSLKIKIQLLTFLLITILLFNITACGNNNSNSNNNDKDKENSASFKEPSKAKNDDSTSNADPQKIYEAALAKKTPIILYFYGANCSYCDLMNPEVDEIASKQKGKLTIIKIDTALGNTNQFISEQIEKYEIMGIPTTVILDSNGKEVENLPGYMKKADLMNVINEKIEP